jgi:mRNA interferase RelE/StbE
MLRLELTAQALKQLRSVPKRDRDAILDKLAAHAQANTGDVKRLKGSSAFRLRHGDWRAVFEHKGETLLAPEIAHRREIYR